MELPRYFLRSRRGSFMPKMGQVLLFLAAIGDDSHYQQPKRESTRQRFKSNHTITPLQGKPSAAINTVKNSVWQLSTKILPQEHTFA